MHKHILCNSHFVTELNPLSGSTELGQCLFCCNFFSVGLRVLAGEREKTYGFCGKLYRTQCAIMKWKHRQTMFLYMWINVNVLNENSIKSRKTGFASALGMWSEYKFMKKQHIPYYRHPFGIKFSALSLSSLIAHMHFKRSTFRAASCWLLRFMRF